MITISLIAPCGMNCGICLGHMREKNVCPGCSSKSNNKPSYCTRCSIYNCDLRKKMNIKYCFSCSRYPCRRLRDLDKRYRSKNGMSMIHNLENIRKYGIRKFVREEKEKWKCVNCGSLLCVHRNFCLSCGAERKIVPVSL